MADYIDAAREKSTLAPVQHLAADPQFAWHRTEIELGRQIQVKDSEIAADQVISLWAQRRPQPVFFFVPLIVESKSADKKSEILVVCFDLGGEFEHSADRSGVVVQRTVIVIQRQRRTAICQTNQFQIRALHPPGLSIGNCGIPAAVQAIG